MEPKPISWKSCKLCWTNRRHSWRCWTSFSQIRTVSFICFQFSHAYFQSILIHYSNTFKHTPVHCPHITRPVLYYMSNRVDSLDAPGRLHKGQRCRICPSVRRSRSESLLESARRIDCAHCRCLSGSLPTFDFMKLHPRYNIFCGYLEWVLEMSAFICKL